jgi:hypothetical protein
MRFILALSLFVTLCGSANAATVYHAHRRDDIVHCSSRSGLDLLRSRFGFAYAPPGPPIHHQPTPYNDQPSPYDNLV